MIDTCQHESTLLEVNNLRVDFDTRDGVAHVLNGVGFSIQPGEVLGIVGESGCGKSMTALSVMGLVPNPPGKVVGGQIKYHGENLLECTPERMREIRGNHISMIFQEPMTALNPVIRVGDQIAESLLLHQKLSRDDAIDKATELLREVQVPLPEKRIHEFPHQLSGGMRQRVMIAIALACEPGMLIADEPTTALDVTVQAQVFDLLLELRQERQMAIILITHDMGAIAEMADRVLVMYAGRVIETATAGDILQKPQHPYTRGLISCVPVLQPGASAERKPLNEIPGIVPSLTSLGRGCAFEPRCHSRLPRCAIDMPMTFYSDTRHGTACWLFGEDKQGQS